MDANTIHRHSSKTSSSGGIKSALVAREHAALSLETRDSPSESELLFWQWRVVMQIPLVYEPVIIHTHVETANLSFVFKRNKLEETSPIPPAKYELKNVFIIID